MLTITLPSNGSDVLAKAMSADRRTEMGSAKVAEQDFHGIAVERLVKAIETTQLASAGGGPRDLHPAIGESLDPVIWALTQQYPYHTPFYNVLRKTSAKSIVEEYNRLKSLGDSGSWFEQGGLPRPAQSEYERLIESVKFMGQMGEITNPMMIAGANFWGDTKAREMYIRQQRMMLDTEEALWYGDASLSGFQFTGALGQHFKAANQLSKWDDLVIDLRGEPLEARWIDVAATRIWDRNYGRADSLWTSGPVKTFLDNQMAALRRVNTGEPAPRIARGTIATATTTSFGTVGHFPELFLGDARLPRTSSAQCETGAPSAAGQAVPTHSVENLDDPSDNTVAPYRRGTNSAGVPVGVYDYSVSAINCYGESVEQVAATSTTVSVLGKQVEVSFDAVVDSGSSERSQVTHYKLFRSDAAGGQRRLVAMFPRNTAQAGQVLIDDGTWLPGTTKAYMKRMEVLSYRQLLPPTTYDLAKVADSHRWMQVQYPTLIDHVPIHGIVFINVGAPPDPDQV